jgi:hypothetical protein
MMIICVSDEIKRIRKVDVAYFNVLPQNLPGNSEKKHKNLSQDSWSVD